MTSTATPSGTTASTPADAAGRREFHRDVVGGIRGYAGWLRNPVSARGAASRHRARFALNGPDVARQVDQMRRDPVGRRVLDERPDLGAALSDMASLGALPEGSLGRAYHAFMDHPEVVPSALLASLLHVDGHFERLDWDDDMKYFVERRGQTHDLTHVLSGYGTSFPAEAINVGFSYGIEGESASRAVAEAVAWLSWAVMWPVGGVARWRRLVLDAHRRGATAAQRRPLPFVFIEELLPLPLDEAREQIGIPPLAAPVDATEAWIRNPVGRRMARGYGRMGAGDRDLELAIALFRAGAPPRDIGRADAPLRSDLIRRLDDGAPPSDLVPLLAAGAEALRAADRRAAA